MNKYDTLSEENQARQRQLFKDIIPYYGKISVYDMEKAFINGHEEQCLRMAMAGKQVMLSHPDIKPEDAIFSDAHFSRMIQEAWADVFTDDDKHFLNDNLQNAAECFRMGFMMADLPEL